MIKPKAINCKYSAGRFCFAHLQNSDRCTDQKLNIDESQGDYPG